MRSFLNIALSFLLFLLPTTLLAKSTNCSCEGRKVIIIADGKVVDPTNPQAQKILAMVNEEMDALEQWEDSVWKGLSQLESLFWKEQSELFKIQQELLRNFNESMESFKDRQKIDRKTLPQFKKPISYPQRGVILVSKER
ncbi:hypothetical protein [Methylacidiphilum caldifontis]|uniref:Uncharacterized protein n=1 Tax=Methylacidiphilum caldifontis TaxID=2795386 RepID=A0A4Y8PAG1_9BACT|nr:hypothetical protein [Methylacidiphilum caldifontis]TFE67537.1 hypothetical protein A7Q10_09555 [Methylacidiphilum caldifontis]